MKITIEERERLEVGVKKISNDDLIEMMKYYRACETIVDSIMSEDDEFGPLDHISNNYYKLLKIVKKELIERVKDF